MRTSQLKYESTMNKQRIKIKNKTFLNVCEMRTKVSADYYFVHATCDSCFVNDGFVCTVRECSQAVGKCYKSIDMKPSSKEGIEMMDLQCSLIDLSHCSAKLIISGVSRYS